MNIEIERKFLVASDDWQPANRKMTIRQAYLAIGETSTIRVRLSDEAAWLTIKGKTVGIVRPEFEYELPLTEAEEIAQLSPYPVIEKTRYFVDHDGLTWEIDVFAGANEGLIVAEVELERADQSVEIPDWVGPEVTGDYRYHNAYMCRHPYNTWSQPE